MKIKKKIGYLLTVVAMLAMMCMDVMSVYAYEQLPDTSKVYMKNYTKRRDTKVYYNASKKGYATTGQLVGICKTYMGIIRGKEKVDGKYYDAIIKNVMESQAFRDLKDGTPYYGVSQYLSVKSNLASHCSYVGNSPTNSAIGSDKYTVGISFNGKTSFNASTTIERAICNVVDNSRPSQRLFSVSYDYLTGSNTSARCNALYGTTYQYGSCTWVTREESYRAVIDVYAKFCFTMRKNGGDMGSTATSSASGIWYDTFTKDMR